MTYLEVSSNVVLGEPPIRAEIRNGGDLLLSEMKSMTARCLLNGDDERFGILLLSGSRLCSECNGRTYIDKVYLLVLIMHDRDSSVGRLKDLDLSA